MKVDVQDVSSCKKTLRIEIPLEDVNAEFEKAYEEVRTTLPVRGFRKGRAPRSVLRMRFGKYVKNEIIEKLIPPAFEKAIEDAKLEILRPLDGEDIEPPIDELLVKEDEPLVFEVSIDVKPEIIVPDLSQLEVEKGDVDVTKQDVDSLLNRLREGRASFAPVEDRPVQEGDYVTLSILATSDGEVLEDREEQVFRLQALESPRTRGSDQESSESSIQNGENMLIPELGQYLMGMVTDEEKEFSVRFSADHPVKHLAGKEVDFRVSLHKIAQKHLPSMDDEFAKDLGEDDMAHLRARKWNELVESRRQEHRKKQENDLLTQLLEKSQFEVPEFLVEKQAKALMRSDRQGGQTAGSEASEKELSQYRALALNAIRKTWIFDEVAKREGIDVTDEDIEAEVSRLAEARNKDPQKYMKLLKDAGRIEGIKQTIWENRIFNVLIEKASPKTSDG